LFNLEATKGTQENMHLKNQKMKISNSKRTK
jgi:hypothetical protein